MSLHSDSWVPGLSQNGPPPGANNARFTIREWYQCDTLNDLKALETHNDRDIRMAVLRGRDAKFDGYLQGIYCSVPHGEHLLQAESDSWVMAFDGQSAWQKLI